MVFPRKLPPVSHIRTDNRFTLMVTGVVLGFSGASYLLIHAFTDFFRRPHTELGRDRQMALLDPNDPDRILYEAKRAREKLQNQMGYGFNLERQKADLRSLGAKSERDVNVFTQPTSLPKSNAE